MNNDPKTVLENLLVWSANRSKMFGLCPRKYYHNYIGSWEGWDTSTSPDTQASYRIKHLTSPALEAGRVVHDQIRVILEKAMAITTEWN